MIADNTIVRNKNLLVIYGAIAVLFLLSQILPSRSINVGVSVINFSGWDMTKQRADNVTRGGLYLFGLSEQTSRHDSIPYNTKLKLRINSVGSALFAIFLGLCAILLPLILLLLLWRPIWAWWLTPTMFISSVWWFPENALAGFHLWFLSLLALSLLVVNSLIANRYFRTWLNAFAGNKSLPFHLPVFYIAIMFVLSAFR